MGKSLKLVFLDGEGNNKILSPNYAREDLTKEEVQEAMESIAALELFEKDQVAKFVTPNKAYYTETIVTDIYQNETI